MAATEMEQFGSCYEKPQFVESLNVLDPDDPLMKRFQDALNVHLIKINGRLTDEFNKLATAHEQAEKEHLTKGNGMYEAQQEMNNQVTSIEQWRTSLETIKCWHERGKKNFECLKETCNIVQHEFIRQHQMAELMDHDIESMLSLCSRLAEYEAEVSNHLTISKRMSEKDASVQRDLIRQKQQMDYLMLRAAETVRKLEKELDVLHRQIQLKNKEKLAMRQTIANADTDLGVLEREQKKLINSWNGVIFSIQQRDKVYDELSTQRINTRESLKNIYVRIEKIKKDVIKMMENNDHLTAVKWKLNEETLSNEGAINAHYDRYQVVQYNTDSLMKLMEHAETQFEAVTSKHQQSINEENALVRELEKLMTQKSELEDEVMEKLENKMTQNKTLKCFNKSIRDTREMMKQFALSMLQVENHYGKCLLEVKKLNNDISIENVELKELDNLTNHESNDVNELHNEIDKYNLLIERKQKEIGKFTEKKNEMHTNISGNDMDMMAPQSTKLASLESDIEILEVNNNKNQRHWLRQEAKIVYLTDEQNGKLKEISRMGKKIITMQEKNVKLQYALDKEHKTEQNSTRRMNELHQRLSNTNTMLAEQKEMRNQLQDKNSIAKDEYSETLQHNEREFINQQNEIENLINQRGTLKEKLRDENYNNYSWEKKLKFAVGTANTIKQQQSPGGDVAIMRSEIRRMEMRLLYLKKVQDKMIRDMEYCVTRRETILESALTKQIKNPKRMHHKQVMFQKRIDGRRFEIKQIKKAIKSIENETFNVKKKFEILQYKDKGNQKLLKNHQRENMDLDKQHFERDIMKHHELEYLVRKQQKINLFQSVRDGKYKTICKSITVLNDEWNNQKMLNSHLIEIMEQTNQDFPRFHDDVSKIILTLQPMD